MKALADGQLRGRARYRVLGPVSVMEAAARAAGISPYWKVTPQGSPVVGSGEDVVVLDYGGSNFPRQADRASGDLSFRLVEDSILHARRGKEDPLHCDAVVTGPISKLAWQMAGRGQYPGHTELFATRCGAKRFGMMFVSPRLRVILATAHVPLMEVRLTTEKVLDVIELGEEACRRMGVLRPRVAVCGLNPHAGEGGMLGQDEQRVIEPAIRAAEERGIDAKGPFPGDTVFIAAVEGKFDLVVAMYHDQGLIPVKLLDRDRAVNVTVGLPPPLVRTSPDHGTAFDIAGMNKAEAGSMKAAIELAVGMSGG